MLFIDPDLLSFFESLTESAHEAHVQPQSQFHVHIKKLRISYILCTVLFCATNGHCSTPLHLLLTDFIDACGGSANLILVLNRLGGAASLDSLNRHMCAVALQRKAKGLLRDINSRAFTIASTDNIDFLQSHASVYAGSQHRSWHGTSIQVVQPQPHKLHCYLYAHAVILTAYQRSFLSPYRAFTNRSYIFRSTFHWLLNGTGFGPRNGGGQKCTKLNGTYVAQVAIEGRSLYDLPRPNGTAPPYATPQGDSM